MAGGTGNISGAERVLRVRHATRSRLVIYGVIVQLVPLSAKLAGRALAPLKLAWKPGTTVPPLGMLPSQVSLWALTLWPVWITIIPQALVICWLPGNVHVSVQLLIPALPVFLMVSGLTT